LAVQKLN